MVNKLDKDLLKFENRNDDWLAKQKHEESLISPWDIDEGHKLKAIHNQNCEARYIKLDHEKKHKKYLEHNASNDIDIQKSIIKMFLLPVFVVMGGILVFGLLSLIINVRGNIFGLIPLLIVVIACALFSVGKRRK